MSENLKSLAEEKIAKLDKILEDLLSAREKMITQYYRGKSKTKYFSGNLLWKKR
ncbi:TPA: hypothetical protein ACGZ96_003089 [Elizabethkingia anophelis]